MAKVTRSATGVRRSAATRSRQQKTRAARKHTVTLFDRAMALLPFTDEQLHEIFLSLIIAAALAAAWLVASLAGVPQLAQARLAVAASDAGFEVRKVKVTGVERMNELKVYERALAERDRPMPLVDLQAVRARLLDLSWVQDARVSRQLPDTLIVDIVEREEHAVLKKPGRLMLVDAQGHELEPISAANTKDKLLIGGPGAQTQVAALDDLLDAAPALKSQVAEAEWVGNRRWNLTFKTGQVLALPEENGPAALVRFATLDGRHRLLGGRATAIDMRVADQAYFRCTGGPCNLGQLVKVEGVMAVPRILRAFAAVNIGSFRVSAMIMAEDENGAMVVLGSSHRKSEGVKRGYITEMRAASHAIRQAVEKAEQNAGTNVSSVWIGCAGAGLYSRIASVEIAIGGRRIEDDDIEHLLYAARDHIQPDGRMVLHAQPAHYTLDGAHGIANPQGLHAEALGVDIHVTLAEGAPVKNLIEAVQMAHLEVEAVVASPLASAYACLSAEERDLGVALIEIGAEVTNVSVHAAGMLLGLTSIPIGSNDITDALASSFGIRRGQAERLKCVSGSAMSSPTDHREMVPVNAPGDDGPDGRLARGADEHNRIPRAELVAVVTERLSGLTGEIHKALKALGFSGARSGQVVLTGGGAELHGIAEFMQAALGRPVRIGKPPRLQGLPEAHATPGFATLAGLCLYAADDPVDIRSVGPSYQPTKRYRGMGLVNRVFQAVREYF